MLIAQINGLEIVAVDEATNLYPGVSFPVTGPTEQWMEENSCMYVSMSKPYDTNTQKLVSVSPYIEITDPQTPLYWVYTVVVEQLTPEDIAKREAIAKQSNKSSAEIELSQTDWTQNSDVADQANPPWLVNQTAFTEYRAKLREIAVNPPVTVTDWPVKPEEIWSNT